MNKTLVERLRENARVHRDVASDCDGPPENTANWQHALDDESAADEIEALRAFAQRVMKAWPVGDVDGDELQEAAIASGLLRPETRHEPCGENCFCAEYAVPMQFKDGVTCYRRSELLTGKSNG